MSEVRYNIVGIEEVGQRLDNYLIRILKGVPKSHIYRLIRAKKVRVNNKRAEVSTRLILGDVIRIPPVRCAIDTVSPLRVSDKLKQQLEQAIIFEDKSLLVLNKPAGIAVHGGSGLSLGLIEALRTIRHDLPYIELVHRLDRETSGCLLFAKKRSVLRAIQALLAARVVTKTYWALLANHWTGAKSQRVEAPLLKNTLKSGERMVIVSQEGKPSLTYFRLLENYQNVCWVEVIPKTGRTHQIRVHSAFLNHPIVGDEKYGSLVMQSGFDLGKKKLFLHARAIEFELDGKKHRYEAALDVSFTETLKQLLR